jgi:hypothetical protein
MVILAKIIIGEEKKFKTLDELYSWEHFEEIKELRINHEYLTKISKLPEGLL